MRSVEAMQEELASCSRIPECLDPLLTYLMARKLLAQKSLSDYERIARLDEDCMDDKSAFIYGTIEDEVYISQPPGFVDPEFPKKNYKVEKALYGLHQAPRAWYETLSTYLLDNGFHRGQIDKTLFIKRVKGDILLVNDWVIDVLLLLKTRYSVSLFCACLKFSASLDRKSTTGGCQFLGSRLISWQCKKQNVVANSTTKAKYIAASQCCGQVLWIQNQFLDYGYNLMQTKIHVYNESAIYIVKNPVYHSKIKNIEIRHHFIRDSYEKRLIEMVKIYTDNNVADLLTKAFDGRLMVYKCSGLYTSAIWIEVGRFSSDIGLLDFKFDQFCSHYGKAVVVSESSVRRDLHLNDEDGTACLTFNEIFENLALMGYETAFEKLIFFTKVSFLLSGST
ncbi:putative ribonuclease H-like domain-containing protein [Tanacetum coccineum]